jgi:hypothetical protein
VLSGLPLVSLFLFASRVVLSRFCSHPLVHHHHICISPCPCCLWCTIVLQLASYSSMSVTPMCQIHLLKRPNAHECDPGEPLQGINVQLSQVDYYGNTILPVPPAHSLNKKFVRHCQFGDVAEHCTLKFSKTLSFFLFTECDHYLSVCRCSKSTPLLYPTSLLRIRN